MSYYKDLLVANNNTAVPLWQFEVSNTLFYDLVEYFQGLRKLHEVDSRDCTLFYALWWKYEYLDGKPSKEAIFSLINNRSFTAEEFYQKAKEGGSRLNLKWIRRENTLYFRTLLMQGGLPLTSISKHRALYNDFLVKVIELKPSDANDIANNYEIIKYLPLSTRNDAIYDTALIISKAVWDDTEEGRKILEVLENNNQRDLVTKLRTTRKTQENTVQSVIKIKALWELYVTNRDNASIIFKTDLPEKMFKEAFANLIEVEEAELTASYNFFCDDTLVATYRKNIKGDFIKYSSTSVVMRWNPENVQLPSLYFLDDSGKKYAIPSRFQSSPSTIIPTLWVQMEQDRWIMLPKQNYNGDKAFILSANNEHCNQPGYTFNIDHQQFCFFEITESVCCKINETEFVEFKLRTPTINWIIASSQPTWMDKANMVIIRSLPRIYFYDEMGRSIASSQVVKQWRKKGEIKWQDKYEGNIPLGIIEFKFCYNDHLPEYEKAFNIGEADLKYLSTTILTPYLSFESNGLNLELSTNELYQITDNGTKRIGLTFLQSNQIPKRIKACISSSNSKLLTEILPPVQGIDIVDNEDKTVKDDYVFLMNNLTGYKIVCGVNESVKLYNSNFPALVIRQQLQSTFIPLRNFSSIIKRLFLLHDSMSTNNIVVMEISGKKFSFKAYNQKLRYTDDTGSLTFTNEGKLLVRISNAEKVAASDYYQQYKLYAVPLNCELEKVFAVELEKCGKGFCFSAETTEKEFIVFDCYTGPDCKILPTYVTYNLKPELAHDSAFLKQNKVRRIDAFALELCKNSITSDEWGKLQRYIDLCNQYNLPFSAFDNIRAACSSSELAAKLFIFLTCCTKSEEEFIRSCEKMEEELGIKFHWCSYQSFQKAIEWAIDAYGDIIEAIIEKVKLFIELKFLDFKKKDWSLPNGFHRNIEIRRMRERLGEVAINELPFRRPWVRKDRKQIIWIEPELDKIKIMARCPVAVALLKLDLYKAELPSANTLDIWHTNNNEVRRNMMYCENIDPEWYKVALAYSITTLN